jgi:hypothetical protein
MRIFHLITGILFYLVSILVQCKYNLSEYFALFLAQQNKIKRVLLMSIVDIFSLLDERTYVKLGYIDKEMCQRNS